MVPWPRCSSCRKVLGSKYAAFERHLKNGRTQEEALNDMGLMDSCCRKTIICFVPQYSLRLAELAITRFQTPLPPDRLMSSSSLSVPWVTGTGMSSTATSHGGGGGSVSASAGGQLSRSIHTYAATTIGTVVSTAPPTSLSSAMSPPSSMRS